MYTMLYPDLVQGNHDVENPEMNQAYWCRINLEQNEN